MRRSIVYRLLLAASLAIGMTGQLGTASAGRLLGAGPAEDVDLSPFNERLHDEFKAEGQVFSGPYGRSSGGEYGLQADGEMHLYPVSQCGGSISPGNDLQAVPL